MEHDQRRPTSEVWKSLRPAARRLRAEQTEAEGILWQRLRRRQQNGYKFRRQHVIDQFIVDFYCPQTRLVIEIDGPVHQKQVTEDQERQRFLESQGFRVLRFTNAEVMDQIEIVLARIAEALGYRD